MADAPSFAKLVPGFDFLQGLVKNAGAALPSIGQWVAPTLNPEELEKRIGELRTVQFWREQNAKMLAATIQALEVQRMTLSTLKTMNVQMEDLRDSLQIRMPLAAPPAPAPAARARAEPPAAPADDSDDDDAEDDDTEDEDDDDDAESDTAAAPAKAKSRASAAQATPAKPPAPGVVDPLQWWGALTKQFTELAANAMKDTTADAARGLAGNVMKQSFDAAAEALQGARPGAKGPAAKAAAKKKPAARKRAAAKR
jgi:ribosomal protein L12E/L44/L45/RPP1/RPP2